jgi:hypothetical protein
MATTFGKLQQSLSHSEFIRKKINNKYKCSGIKSAFYYPEINRTDLIFGLYSKMDLTDVCTVGSNDPCILLDTCPCVERRIDFSQPFYYDNKIDPKGELFGLSPCGELNYTRYLRLNH